MDVRLGGRAAGWACDWVGVRLGGRAGGCVDGQLGGPVSVCILFGNGRVLKQQEQRRETWKIKGGKDGRQMKKGRKEETKDELYKERK